MVVVERLGDRLVERDDVDLRAARAQRVGQHVAALGGAGDQRALDRHVRERLDEPLGDRALGHDVGLDAARRAARAAVPGPIAATVTPASSRASRRRSSSSSAPLGEVTHDEVVVADRSGSGGSSGSIRIAGASTTAAPSARSRAASALACARARVTATVRPCSGRALEPGELLAQRGDRRRRA